MGESAIHIMLVEHMAEWVADELLGGDAAAVLLDLPSKGPSGRPPAINGHIPDLYVDEKTSSLLVVGEAKTARDLESERSEKQISAFLEYCALHTNVLVVGAVPWDRSRLAQSLLRMLKRRLGERSVETTVLEMLPG